MVPISTALLGIVLLGDRLDAIAWVGAVTVTAGLLLVPVRRDAKRGRAALADRFA